MVRRVLATLLLAAVGCTAFAAPLPTLEQRLREAALAGDIPKIRLLLNRWPDVNATDHAGNTALMFAACGCGPANSENSLELMRLLLANGADPNLKNNSGETALMIAAARGRGNAVQLLLDRGAQAKKLDLYGDTALTLAEQASHKDIADLLRGAQR